jgi:hypothetical protein
MKIYVECEESQTVCKSFRLLGFEAYSRDIKDCSGGKPEWHIKGNSLDYINDYSDIRICHPVCKFLANSGVKNLVRNGRRINPERWDKLEEAIMFFNSFKKANSKMIAIENPIPHCYARDGFKNRYGRWVEGIGGYTQIVQPWQFGHKEMKATCLWLMNLPKLKPTNVVGPPPKDVEERKQWAKVHRMPPGPDRERLRSKTYKGIANAMSDQWGSLITIKR